MAEVAGAVVIKSKWGTKVPPLAGPGEEEGLEKYIGAGEGEKESGGEKEDWRGREKGDGRVEEEEGNGSGPPPPPPAPTVGRRAGNNADGITRVVAEGG